MKIACFVLRTAAIGLAASAVACVAVAHLCASLCEED